MVSLDNLNKVAFAKGLHCYGYLGGSYAQSYEIESQEGKTDRG